MKENFKKYFYLIIILIILIIGILFIICNKKFDLTLSDEVVIDNEDSILSFEKEKIEDENIVFYVDIKGEVVNPGVYNIKSNSRIIDVVNLAGGLTKNADTSLLNLSKKISDEMYIKIYSKKEVIAAKESIKSEPEIIEIIKEVEKECICPTDNNACIDSSTKNDAVIEKEDDIIGNDIENNTVSKEENVININTASKEELMNIPGVGESKAIKIIEYRNKVKFTKIEDILNVSGIGESIFEKIKENITV